MKKILLIVTAVLLSLQVSALEVPEIISDNTDEIVTMVFQGKCPLKISYRNSKAFSKLLSFNLNVRNGNICTHVDFENNDGVVYNLDSMPMQIQIWLKAIEETGGTIQYIEVNRGIWVTLWLKLVKLIFNTANPDYKKLASDLEAEVYWAKNAGNSDLKDILSVKFVPRHNK